MKKKKAAAICIVTGLILAFLYVWHGHCGYELDTDETINQNETEQSSEMEADDRDSDYQLKNIDMTQKEADSAKKNVFTIAERCREIYEKEAAGQECSVELTEKAVHQMADLLASSGYPVTCGEYDYNMQNYKEVNQCLKHAKKGQHVQTEFYAINTGGVFFYYHLEFRDESLLVTSSSAFFNTDGKLCLNVLEKIKVYQWEYTDKGWLIWEKAKSRNQEMDMHVFYRVLPLDQRCRALAKTCILPISYFCNNLFSVNWDENDRSRISFNDLFDVLYAMEHGTYPSEDQYAGGVPGDVFESLIQRYFSISTGELRKEAGYRAGSEKYPWVEINGYHHSPMLKPIPEVVKCVENANGTITMYVEAILLEDGTDCAFRHKVTIRKKKDGTWKYVSNEVKEQEVKEVLNYQPRCPVD